MSVRNPTDSGLAVKIQPPSLPPKSGGKFSPVPVSSASHLFDPAMSQQQAALDALSQHPHKHPSQHSRRPVSPLVIQSPSPSTEEAAVPTPAALSPFLTPRARDISRSVSPTELQDLSQNQTFMGIVHDSGNDLTSSLGYLAEISKMLAESEQTGIPPDLAKLNSLVINAQLCSEAAHDVFQETLCLGKLGARQLELVQKPFSIEELEKKVRATTGLRAQQKGIDLKFKYINLSSQDHFLGDLGKIEQVLKNFVLNSIKFTKIGSVEVCIERMPQIENQPALLVVKIIDTGVGMTPQDQAKLFKPFSQGGNAESKSKGMGIGLLNSAKLVHMMNGQEDPIRLESVLNRGTIFEFDLPLKPIVIPKPASTAGVASASSQPPFTIKAMALDDEQGNLCFLSKVLQNIGAKLDPASQFTNGADLLQKIGILPDPQRASCRSSTASIPELPLDAESTASISELRTSVSLLSSSSTDSISQLASEPPAIELPDVIFIDCQMPGMSGIEVAQCIRDFETSHPERKRTILALTSGSKQDLNLLFDFQIVKGTKKEAYLEALTAAQKVKDS